MKREYVGQKSVPSWTKGVFGVMCSTWSALAPEQKICRKGKGQILPGGAGWLLNGEKH